MALFDSKSTEILDDTIPLSAAIETAENIQGFTEYVIKVTRGYNAQKWPGWTVRRRFRDFVALNAKLTENASHLDLGLPPKKMFGNLNREFVAKRMQELQVYLDGILIYPCLALSRHVKAFLDPKNYSVDFTDLALQNVSMYIRGSQAAVVHKTLSNIGWRIHKTYFLIKSADRPKDERQLVAWASYGPDFSLDYADAQLVLDFMSKIKHSQIRVPRMASCTEKGSVMVKGLMVPNGTLRDVLCNAKPEQSFIQKYACPKEPNCFDGRQLQLLGRKILEILKFLKDKNIPFGHLHCGNLAVTDDERVQVLDIENDILGLPPLYRAAMVQCKALKTYDDIVVYCFGHTFYEIAIGTPLNQPCITNELISTDCPQPFVSLLQEILSQEATQTSMPSLEDLLSRDVFLPTWYQTISTRDDVDFKVPSKIKQLLAKCRDAFMERLHQDQAEFRRAVKMKKAKDYIESEEQKKLRKRAMRLASKEAVKETPPSTASSSGASNGTVSSSGSLDSKNGQPPSLAPALQRPTSSGSDEMDASKPVVTSVHQQLPFSGVPSPPPPPPPVIGNLSSGPGGDNDRSALLSSIRNFTPGQLKKTITKDKSKPKI